MTRFRVFTVAFVVFCQVGRLLAAEPDPFWPRFRGPKGDGISADVAELFRQMYVGIADGTVAFEGKAARQVRGALDVEAVLRKLLGK